MRHGLENGNEEQSAHTHRKNEVALPCGGGIRNLIGIEQFWPFHFPFHPDGHDREGHHHADDAWKDEVGHDHRRGQLTADPQHGGGDISDGRPSTSSIGTNDDRAGIEPAGGLVGDELSQERNHDNGSRQIVQSRGEKEGQDPDDPQQPALLSGGDFVGDDREAIVGIHELHNRHGPQQKEKNAGNFLHVMEQPVLKKHLEGPMTAAAMVKGLERFQQMSWCLVPTEHEDGPAQSARDQCTGSLINVQVVLKGNEQVSNDEYDNEYGSHVEEICELDQLFKCNGHGRSGQSMSLGISSMTALHCRADAV